jgi:predicted RNA binding protein YcfA (HicA-like mRNA interferase family)
LTRWRKEYEIYASSDCEVVRISQDDVAKILKRYGWIDTGRGKGSHKVFIEPATGRVTTVPKPKGKDLPKGTLGEIRKQTGIKEIS